MKRLGKFLAGAASVAGLLALVTMSSTREPGEKAREKPLATEQVPEGTATAGSLTAPGVAESMRDELDGTDLFVG